MEETTETTEHTPSKETAEAAAPPQTPQIDFIATTAWYLFKAKFDHTVYISWIFNLISCVNNYKLVIYTDQEGHAFLQKYFGHILSTSPNIRIVFKEFENFYCYKYKDAFIRNQERADNPLRDRIDWRVNMLWCEKIACVSQTIADTPPPPTAENNEEKPKQLFCWIDAGYSRILPNPEFPNQQKLARIDSTKIYYACVNKKSYQLNELFALLSDRDPATKLPRQPIPSNQISIGGGFFIISRTNIDWWSETFYATLERYIQHERLYKDDQVIILDSVALHKDRFFIVQEQDPTITTDQIWFQFNRLLA